MTISAINSSFPINGITYPQESGCYSLKFQTFSQTVNFSETVYIEIFPPSFSYIKLQSLIKYSGRNLIKVSLIPENEIKEKDMIILEFPTQSPSLLRIFGDLGQGFPSKDEQLIYIEIISPKDFKSKN